MALYLTTVWPANQIIQNNFRLNEMHIMTNVSWNMNTDWVAQQFELPCALSLCPYTGTYVSITFYYFSYSAKEQ